MVSLGGVLYLQGVVDLLVARLRSRGDPQVMDLVLIVCKDDGGTYMGRECLFDSGPASRISICPQVVFDCSHDVVRKNRDEQMCSGSLRILMIYGSQAEVAL